jgi:hypothetical protein
MAVATTSAYQCVANDILEATMLAGALAGNDTTLAKLTKRSMRYKTGGSLEEGNLSFSYNFPDGSKADYKLIHGAFSTTTGFQAAAFEKHLTDSDGTQHHCVKLLFPGTAMRNQFSDLNAFDTFWLKRIGSQVHNTKEWLETKVMPRVADNMEFDISGHCLGTQSALWAKLYLQEEKHCKVNNVALLEPTAPGLVIDDLVSDIESIYGISKQAAIRDLYRGVYSVFVDPPTIVSPFGVGNLWDTSAVGERSYKIHLPPTKLYEELHNARRSPKKFYIELQEKMEEERATLIKEREVEKEKKKDRDKDKNRVVASDGEVPEIVEKPERPDDAPSHPHKDDTAKIRGRAFFKTKLGTELGQQFFKNHYLLSMTSEILNPKHTLEHLISDSPRPDARAMLAHRAPRLDAGAEQSLRQLLTANVVDNARGIANAVTQFCLNESGRRGVPLSIEPDYIWNTPQIQTMDDTLEGNYPRPFYKSVATSKLRQLFDGIATMTLDVKGEISENPEVLRVADAAMTILREMSPRKIVPPLPGLPEDVLNEQLNEVQARAALKHMPALREALVAITQKQKTNDGVAQLALASLDEAEKAMRRTYGIKPEHDRMRYL